MKGPLADEDFINFWRHLTNAFDELHALLLSKLANSSTYIPTHYNYSTLSYQENGMPSLSTGSLFGASKPKHYNGLIYDEAAFTEGDFSFEPDKFPMFSAFLDFIATTPSLRDYFSWPSSNPFLKFIPPHLLISAIDAYIHINGRGPISVAKRDKLLSRLRRGIFCQKLPISFVIPIALTRLEVGHIRLSEECYISRIPRSVQLGRKAILLHGSGATESVIDAATHMFVSRGWHVQNSSYSEATESLSKFEGDARRLADQLFGALRLATGIETGFAQALYAPRGWALGFSADLPHLYGVAVRGYPGSFDNFGWLRKDLPIVSSAQSTEIRRVFKLLRARTENRIEIAVRRLNACLTRDDPIDSILDAAIGLEVLLGDNDSQAISYKLRMRSAALASLPNSSRTPGDVSKDVKKIYAERSKIVHGNRSKSGKQLDARPNEHSAKQVAANLLRFVLDRLLENPEFINPEDIDLRLLLHTTMPSSESSKT